MTESDQQHSPAALFLGKRSSSYYAGGLLGPNECLDLGENLVPQGFDPWTVQSVTSRNTEYANPAHSAKLAYCKLQNRFYIYIYFIFTLHLSKNNLGL